MKKPRRRKRQYENPINQHVAETLTHIKEVASTLKDEVGDQSDALEVIKNDLLVLEQTLEMNFWVNLRMTHEGYFDPASGIRDDVEELVEMVQEYQRKYLAATAVASFLRTVRDMEVVREDPEEDA